jgi:diguanylate cyclase (GGDEF)-like protein
MGLSTAWRLSGASPRRAGRDRRFRSLWRVFDWLVATREPTSPEIQARLIAYVIDSRLSLLVGFLSIAATILVAAWRTGEAWPWLWLAADLAIVGCRLAILRAAERDAGGSKARHQAAMLATGLLWCLVFSAGMFMCVRSDITSLAVLAAVNTVAVASVSSMRIAAVPRYGVAVVLLCYLPFGLALATSGKPGLIAVAALVPLWMGGLVGLLLQNHRLIRRMIQAELQTRQAALTDKLTGLPNRLCLEEKLQALCSGLARGERFALLCLDLDGFKAVNDNHGHGAGDLLLRALAGRLHHCLRDHDTACRLGGDEFVVLLPGAGSDEAAFVAKRIIATIGRPFDVGINELLGVGVSIGSATAPDQGLVAADLMAAADHALYAAKSAGKGTHRAFVAAASRGGVALSA